VAIWKVFVWLASHAALRLPHLTAHNIAALDSEVRYVLTGLAAGDDSFQDASD
jgi:hypothetical protein